MIDADVLFVLRVESTLFATELPKAITKDENWIEIGRVVSNDGSIRE